MSYLRALLLTVFSVGLSFSSAQECNNAYSPVQDWTWSYRTTSSDSEGKAQTVSMQKRTLPTAAGFDAVYSAGGQPPSKYSNRCMDGAQTSLQAPSIAGAQVTKASVTGANVPAVANWRVGYEWTNIWNLEGRKGLLSGKGEFTTRYRIVALENVKVPAGEFEAFKVEASTTLTAKAAGIPLNQTMPTTYLWYAKDVGLVKQVWDKNGIMELVSLKK